MPDIPISGHKQCDALWNREYLVAKREPKLEADGSITTKPITTAVPEARECTNPKTCVWLRIVGIGGEPCNTKCRWLKKGDYFIEDVGQFEDLP